MWQETSFFLFSFFLQSQVGSRRVIQWAAAIMILFGVLSKLAALMVTIPNPIIGGIFTVMFGIITAVGLSNLQFVDLNSTRNLFVLGFSIFFSLVLPKWMAAQQEAGLSPIDTGSVTLDSVITVVLTSSMFIAMLLGFILDNTMPGTPEERGLVAWQGQHQAGDQEEEEEMQGKNATSLECYDLPFITPWLLRQHWAKYVPSLPSYKRPALPT